MVAPNGFVPALALTALGSAIFTGLAWFKRTEPAAAPLVAFNITIGAGLSAFALDIVLTAFPAQLWSALAWLVAQAFVAPLWVYVAITYTGLNRWDSPKMLGILCVEPVVFTLLVLTPQTRSMLVTLPDFAIVGSLFYIGGETGILMLLHYGYWFSVMIAGTLLFVQLFVRVPNLYRTEAAAVTVAAVAPWLTVWIQAFGLFPNVDVSSITWALAGMALTAGLYRYETIDPVPTARQAVIDRMGDGLIVLDEDDLIGDFNPAARDMIAPDADPDSLNGNPIERYIPGWDALESTDRVETALETSGDRRFVEIQVRPVSDRFDRSVGRSVLLRDVTTRTRREQNLARYKAVFESVRDTVYVLDADDRFVMVNEPFTSLTGIDESALLGEPFETILAEGSASGDGPDERETPTEVTVETADGRPITCETHEAPVSFEGAETGVVGILRDISYRKRVEESLAVTTERLEALVRASPLAIVSVNAKREIEVWNRAATETFGWKPGEVQGQHLPMSPDERAEELADLLNRVFGGERITGYETELTRKDGGRLDAALSIAPVTAADGSVDGAVAVIADLTDRKSRESRLERQNERLDEFVGLLSHDLRNPLQVAVTHLELLERREDIDGTHLQKAHQSLQRMETLIEDALALAREGREIGEQREIALGHIARRAWNTVQTDGATLTVQQAEDTVLTGDPSRVIELLENLFRNAVEHNELDGTEREDPLTVRVEATPDGFAVEDDGIGLDDAKVESLFEPGYSTISNGTGLGLAIVRRIADAHEWEVSATEGTDGGARFEFRIRS